MLVYFAIILVALLGFCGLAIDTGRMELRQDQLQAAADAGALAAAGELWHSSTTSNGQSIMQAAADADIATYETANGVSSTSPSTVKLGPAFGPFTGDYSAVQVTVTQKFTAIFLGLLKANTSVTLSASAVAQMPPCMVFLGAPAYTGTDDLWVTSSSVNSVQDYWTCPLYTRTGVSVDYFSKYYNSQVRSSGPASSSSFGSTTTTPIFNVPVISDPLAYITSPVPLCSGNAPISQRGVSNGTIIPLVPGTYCGKLASFTPGPVSCGEAVSVLTPAIDIEGTYSGCPSQSAPSNGGICGSNPPVVTFAPGLYVFVGGINLTCVTASGAGATLYFTKSSTVGYGQMRLTASTWNVSAPVDASNNGVPGVSVMNDRNWTGTTDDFQLWYSTWNADGVVYLTGTGIFDYNTPMSAPNYLNIVAANMYNYDGSIHPATNYASLPGGNPLHTVIALVQ